MQSGKVAATLATWGQNFIIRANVTINSYPDGWNTVFQIGDGGDQDAMSRYPYLGVNNGQFVFVLISKDGGHIRHNIELGQKYQIEVSQLYDDDSGTYMYDITVDGQTIAGNKGSGTIANEKAFVVSNATVYLSTDFRFGTAADATVEWFYLESWVQ